MKYKSPRNFILRIAFSNYCKFLIYYLALHLTLILNGIVSFGKVFLIIDRIILLMIDTMRHICNMQRNGLTEKLAYFSL